MMGCRTSPQKQGSGGIHFLCLEIKLDSSSIMPLHVERFILKVTDEATALLNFGDGQFTRLSYIYG